MQWEAKLIEIYLLDFRRSRSFATPMFRNCIHVLAYNKHFMIENFQEIEGNAILCVRL